MAFCGYEFCLDIYKFNKFEQIIEYKKAEDEILPGKTRRILQRCFFSSNIVLIIFDKKAEF